MVLSTIAKHKHKIHVAHYRPDTPLPTRSNYQTDRHQPPNTWLCNYLELTARPTAVSFSFGAEHVRLEQPTRTFGSAPASSLVRLPTR